LFGEQGEQHELQVIGGEFATARKPVAFTAKPSRAATKGASAGSAAAATMVMAADGVPEGMQREARGEGTVVVPVRMSVLMMIVMTHGDAPIVLKHVLRYIS
jgi:hypothetical protein